MTLIVLSHFQTAPLLQARQAGVERVQISPDLGRTTVEAAVEQDGVRFPGGERLDWAGAATISDSERGCFVLEPDGPRKIQFFSDLTDQLYSLMPTHGAPTMLISGIPMHRFKNTDPHADTLAKIKAITPITGQVLDTCTGLGYTAIEAARTADHVTTIELDPAAVEVARLNPWSQGLFDRQRITQLLGDSFERAEAMPDARFDCIIHDPPTFSLAGDLYSAEFYGHLFRLLKPGGKLFHYIGDLESKSGRVVSRGAARRLQEAGFRKVIPQPEAFGLLAKR